MAFSNHEFEKAEEGLAEALRALRAKERRLREELTDVEAARKQAEGLLQHVKAMRQTTLPGVLLKPEGTPSESGVAPAREAAPSAPVATPLPLPQRVRLELQKGPRTTAELFENLDISDRREQKSMRMAIYRLQKRGEIESTGKGNNSPWRLVQ